MRIYSLFLILLLASSQTNAKMSRMVSDKFREVMTKTDIMEYDTFISQYMEMDEEERCKVCLSIIIPVVEVLKESTIEDAVVNSLNESCDRVGILFRGTCKDFVGGLIPSVFSILLDVIPEANCGRVVGEDETTLCPTGFSYEYLEPKKKTTTKSSNTIMSMDPFVMNVVLSTILSVLVSVVTVVGIHQYTKRDRDVLQENKEMVSKV